MTADDVLNNFIDEVNSTQFLFKADENDVIKAVYMKGR